MRAPVRPPDPFPSDVIAVATPPFAAWSDGASPNTRAVVSDSPTGEQQRGLVECELGEPRHDARTGTAYDLNEVIGEPEPDRPGCQSQDEALDEQLHDESST